MIERWHQRIRDRDAFGSEASADAEAALDRAREALARYSAAVFKRMET